MLPQTPPEAIVWILRSLIADFCEEVIFRGYLQRQFSLPIRSFAGGIGLQAIGFGLSHGYQGWKQMLVIAVYGTCFGLLAHWRHSLRPVCSRMPCTTVPACSYVKRAPGRQKSGGRHCRSSRSRAATIEGFN
jgi:hypothetical protein